MFNYFFAIVPITAVDWFKFNTTVAVTNIYYKTGNF